MGGGIKIGNEGALITFLKTGGAGCLFEVAGKIGCRGVPKAGDEERTLMSSRVSKASIVGVEQFEHPICLRVFSRS